MFQYISIYLHFFHLEILSNLMSYLICIAGANKQKFTILTQKISISIFQNLRNSEKIREFES